MTLVAKMDKDATDTDTGFPVSKAEIKMKRLLCPFLTCTLVVKMAEETADIDAGAPVSKEI
jgi:hypothetical protein